MTSMYIPPAQVDTVAELQAFDGATIRANSVVHLMNPFPTGGNLSGTAKTYKWLVGYAGVDATSQLVIPPVLNPGVGKWVLIDTYFNLQFNGITFAQADGSALFTVPAAWNRIRIVRPMIEVGTPWTGGAASSIGISSSNANYNTKGDIMGGAAGNVAADLVAGFRGSAGTKLAAVQPPVVLTGGDTIRWDRITSAFTAGNGNVNIDCLQIQ